MTTKVKLQARDEAREALREMLKPGDTVYTTVRHVSRSGMMRAIDAYVMEDNQPRWVSSYVAKAIEHPFSERYEAVRMDGCGMDMGFALVYDLSHVLFGDGFGCIGEGCPSNDHSNGDRDYTPHGTIVANMPPVKRAEHAGETVLDHWHQSGGYALNHRWL